MSLATTVALALGALPVTAQEEAPAAEIEAAAPEAVPAPVPVPAPAPPVSGEASDYVIEASDVVRVLVWRNPDLSAEVPVRPDGRISVPLLGDVQAAGLTTAQLREAIASGLSEYITAPDVTVMVANVNSKVAFVVGEVARSMAVPLTRDMRVLDALAVAGGFTPYANRGKVKILRAQPDGSVEEHKFNYGRFVKGKEPGSNILLRPGDTIVVPD